MKQRANYLRTFLSINTDRSPVHIVVESRYYYYASLLLLGTGWAGLPQLLNIDGELNVFHM